MAAEQDSKKSEGPGTGRPRAVVAYVSAWGVMALAAAGYIAVVAFTSRDAVKPVEVAASGKGADRSADAVHANENASLHRISRIAKSNNGKLDRLNKDVGAIRKQVGQLQKADQRFDQRLTGLEKRLPATASGDVPSSGETAESLAQATSAVTVPSGEDGQGTTVAPTLDESLIVGITIDSAGTEPDDAAAAGEAQAARDLPLPDRRRIGVKLGDGPTVESVRLSWDLLRERHATLLAGLAPRYLAGGGNGDRGFQLITGPFRNAAMARSVCDKLKSDLLACEITTYSGDAL